MKEYFHFWLRDLIRFFSFNHNGIISIFPADYKEFLDMYNGGSGSVGENSYLQIWAFEDIDELNKDYEVVEFLSKIVLIGSDGGDTAYGINQ